MKYTLQKEGGLYRMLRYGEPVSGRPNNAELEFWLETERLRESLKTIAALGDTGSHEHGAMFGGNAPGWRVAEKMREVAQDALRGS